MASLVYLGSPGFPFLLTSPDRPAIWYNWTGDKLEQSLEWNGKRQELLARVAYSELESRPLRDQYFYDTFGCLFRRSAWIIARTSFISSMVTAGAPISVKSQEGFSETS
jgi:hypothetical protein